MHKAFFDCLFRDGETITAQVVVEGIMGKIGFHKDRLESHRAEIGEMLMQLPIEFQVDKGGGWSFLNACMTSEGEQWTGEHPTVEQLLALGLATDQAHYLMPREMWKVFPGGMPYFSVGAAPKLNLTLPESSD